MISALKGACLGLAIAIGAAASAAAAPVGFFLSAPVAGGPFDGTPLDFFIGFDDDYLFGGDEVLSPIFGDLNVFFDGDPDFATLDAAYPLYPQLRFVDFVPRTFDFLVTVETYPTLAAFGIASVAVGFQPGVGFFELVYDPAEDIFRTSSTMILLAPVPLPAGLPLGLGAIGLLALAARRRARG